MTAIDLDRWERLAREGSNDFREQAEDEEIVLAMVAELRALRAVREAAVAVREKPSMRHVHSCALLRWGKPCDCGSEARWAALRAALDAVAT